VARARRRLGPIAANFNLGEEGVELGNVIVGVRGIYFKLVQVVEKDPLALALPAEHVDVVIDDAGGVAVSGLWNVARLLALDPAKKLKFVWVVPGAGPLHVNK